MTPMIDVVFLLIIFFLVSSHLASQEVQVELDLPSAASGQQKAEAEGRRLVVNILPDEADGRRFMIGGRRWSADELTRLIRHEKERTEGDLEVCIRGDRRVPYGQVEPVMLACVSAGVWNVTFAVTGEGR